MKAILTGLLAAALLLAGPVAAAQARQTMTFTPGDRSRVARAAPRHPYSARMDRHRRYEPRRQAPAVPRTVRKQGGGDAGEAVAKPGAGFTLQDGVLTYPAPARFQPQNLKRR